MSATPPLIPPNFPMSFFCIKPFHNLKYLWRLVNFPKTNLTVCQEQASVVSLLNVSVSISPVPIAEPAP